MAVASSSSSLNPNAPLFIPAAYRQVEDFSPQWWDLVHTTAWFRDHWFRQQHHQLHQTEAQHDAALPDDLLDTEALFYALDHHHQHQELETRASHRGGARSPSPSQQHFGLKAPGRRVIHQPR